MNYQFRNDAQVALQRAKAEMASGEDHRLRYAALELRIALEALTYDRAQLYAEEIPPSEFHTWQPGKLLKILIEIEPLVNQNSVIRYKKEATSTSQEGDWKTLGHDTVIPMKTVHKHHNALGSMLHMATMKQLLDMKALDAAQTRTKCKAVVADLEAALASNVRANLGNFGIFECLKCGANVRKRLSADRSPIEAVCYGKQSEVGCGAKYTLAVVGDRDFEATPHRSLFSCLTQGCDHEFSVWRSEVQEDASWVCPKCATEIRVRYVVSAVSKPAEVKALE
ncbi:hypothetical protein EV674_1163 [Simplicispira metamorpha]|uniref:Uncharacterized protein n=1 Tax=Simplicispira metamorpha TaxID=80881 RepID=A0A4R2N704_9BURK|nr:hypothetical protein EV674_1163 [Simplicispira metamorpha]